MKKFLPKTTNDPKGFTLIELLVVISIIAILFIISLTVFTNFQKRARDAVRRADVDAISKAMEVNYTNGLYVPLAANQFANNIIPTDPTNTNVVPDNACPGVCEYCVRQGAVVQTPGACSIATGSVAAGTPAGSSANPFWMICANLEAGGAVTFHCKGNQQ